MLPGMAHPCAAAAQKGPGGAADMGAVRQPKGAYRFFSIFTCAGWRRTGKMGIIKIRNNKYTVDSGKAVMG